MGKHGWRPTFCDVRTYTLAQRFFLTLFSRRTIKDKRIDMGRLNKLYIVAPEVFTCQKCIEKQSVLDATPRNTATPETRKQERCRARRVSMKYCGCII
jgi:hypothetical protein